MKNIIPLIVILSLTSCKLMQGIKQEKSNNPDELRRNVNISSTNQNQFFIDSTYKSHLLRTPNPGKHTLKNHLQPIQCLYFDSLGIPLAYFINCYANPGLLRLKWNDDGQFNTFPPKGNAPLDTLMKRDDLLQLIKPLPMQFNRQ